MTSKLHCNFGIIYENMSRMYWSLGKYSSNRNIHSSAVNPEKVDNLDSDDINAVPLRKFDKRIFVWSGKFKRIEDVPDRASRSAVAKAQSVCRIKACNYTMLAVIIAAGFYIMSGKGEAAKGMSIAKMNEEWHKEYNRKYEEEQKKLNK